MDRGQTVQGGQAGEQRARLEGKLAAVFAGVFGISIEQVHPDLRPEDLPQWDSIGHVTLVVAIEEAFSISLSVDEIMELTSFGVTLEALERRTAAGDGSPP
jgi:acyl carrier protein